MSDESMLDLALELWERGFKVIPLGTAGERPPKYIVDRFISTNPARPISAADAYVIAKAAWPKTPRFSWKALQSRDVEREEVEGWWAQYPQANIGIVCGEILVIDADSNESVEWVTQESGITSTPFTVSTSKGKHFYYRVAPGSEYRNTADAKAKLDVRATGGYVVGPGSTHDSGHLYEETIAPGFDVDSISDLPLITDNDIRLISGYNGIDITPMGDGGLLDMRGIQVPYDARPALPGERNNHATSLAGQYITAGSSLQATMAHLVNWNNKNPDPLPDTEIAQVVSSVSITHTRKTGQPVPVESPAELTNSPSPVPDSSVPPVVGNPVPENLTAPSSVTESTKTLETFENESTSAPALDHKISGEPVHTAPPPPPPGTSAPVFDPNAPPPPPSTGFTLGLDTAKKAFHDKFFTLGELNNKPIVALDNFWEESLIFRRSRILIAGEPKIGKSRFSLSMAVQAACGGEWLGSMFHKPIRVIWFQAEIREWHLRERTGSAVQSLTPQQKKLVEQNLMVSDRFDCDLLNPIEAGMIDTIFERHKPDLVIFDPLINFISANENDAQEVGKALRQLNYFEEKFDCAVALIHHTRKLESIGRGKKAEKQAATFDDVRGSSAITGWPDMGIVLSGTPEKTLAAWMARACKPPAVGYIGWSEEEGRYIHELGGSAPVNVEYAQEEWVAAQTVYTAMIGILAGQLDVRIRRGELVGTSNMLAANGRAHGLVLRQAIDKLLLLPNVELFHVDGDQYLVMHSDPHQSPENTDPLDGSVLPQSAP